VAVAVEVVLVSGATARIWHALGSSLASEELAVVVSVVVAASAPTLNRLSAAMMLAKGMRKIRT
jgi:hypothetical protein